tara:strand:+ start:848 stop:1333 length:486 start_codon:yes stop_codon:yes gene_type:complete
MKLPHGKELVQFLPISDLYTEYNGHDRLMVFAEKGLACVSCNRVGTFLAVGQEMPSYKRYKKRGTVGAYHIDLYTDDFVLMTVDHIIPKAVCKQLGWTAEQTEHLDNKQPMCDPCNGSKSDKLVTTEQMKASRPQKNILRKGEGAIWDLIPNIHRLLGDPS